MCHEMSRMPTDLRLSLDDLESFCNDLVYLLILVLKQAECECNVIPLPLAVATRQPGSQLVCQLLRVLVL